MKLHVLPGDATVETFRASGIEGSIAVCRECLVEGDVSGQTRDEFWRRRAAFIAATHGERTENYFKNVVEEFEKLTALSTGNTAFLWFEYELFCQVNYWFCLSLLNETVAEVYRVSPLIRNEGEIWKGFGNNSADDLNTCLSARVAITTDDIARGRSLWHAFRNNDVDALRKLSETPSGAFPMLEETVEAAIAKDERPQAVVREIIGEGISGFENVFEEFSKRAGVYGFGDAQVKRIIENSANV